MTSEENKNEVARKAACTDEDVKALEVILEDVDDSDSMTFGEANQVKALLARLRAAESVCTAYGNFALSYGGANWQESKALEEAYRTWQKVVGR